MKRSSRALVALVLACAILPAAFADEAAIRKNIAERVPDFPKIDEVTKTADPRPLRAAHRHRRPLHRRAGQLPDRRPADRDQDPHQPHRAAHRQAHGDRFQDAAAEGRDGLEAGHRREKAGRLRRSELRLLQEVRARPAVGQGRHRLHLPLSDPRWRFAREVEADLVRQGQHQGLARVDDQGHADDRQPAVRHLGAAAQRRARPASHASTARPAWCSKTAGSSPARSVPSRSKSSSPRAAPRRRARAAAARLRAASYMR